ncbi:hypothetical protein ACIBEA_21615 [Streptomyces sp. NPDC051555]|uniref:hypothetical protein n=1 Tax=Streptomyces sp. NPDC051555 TaxID=3365657 RepID=UPI0037A473DB
MPRTHEERQRRTRERNNSTGGRDRTPKGPITSSEIHRLRAWSEGQGTYRGRSGGQGALTSLVAGEEDRLGIFLSKQEGPRKAAQDMLSALYKALTHYACWKGFPEEKIDGLVRQAFFQDDPGSAGQVGLADVQERYESLLAPDANVREIMTAVYNASYAKIFGNSGNPEVLSLKGIITDFYLTPAADAISTARFIGDAGLNDTYLSALSDFVRALAEKKGPGTAPDVLTPPWLAEYSSAADASDYARAMESRKWRSSIEHPMTSVGDLQGAREPMGLNETEYLRSFVYAFKRDDLDTATYTVDEALAQHGAKSLKELRKHTDVALVKENYKTDGNGTYVLGADGKVIVETVDVTAGKVKWVTVPRDARQPQVPDADIPLPWRTGEEYFTVAPDSAWSKDVHDKQGHPVRTGTSGTTMRMLVSYGALGTPGGKPTDFLYALLAWMLPRHDHSLYEIFRGAQMMARTGAGPDSGSPSFAHGGASNDEIGKLVRLLKIVDEPGGLPTVHPELAAAFAADFPGQLIRGTYSPRS